MFQNGLDRKDEIFVNFFRPRREPVRWLQTLQIACKTTQDGFASDKAVRWISKRNQKNGATICGGEMPLLQHYIGAILRALLVKELT